MKPLPVAVGCFALALLTFFQFPGHTWLQQDTQIYVPILEHQRDPAVLRNDILARQPQVAFTLYDEVTRALRAVTGRSFHEVLAAQQIVTRALGIWGLYLMALSLGLGSGPAFLVAAICSLGAMITGPQVLSFEYEPTPRAFAVPLLFCAMGLAAHRRYVAAGIAAAGAFVYHPPTALPFWALFLVLVALSRRPLAYARGSDRSRDREGAGIWCLVPLVAAVAVLAAAAHGEGGQAFFGRLTPLQEQLQRMRAPYAWISTWHAAWIVHYCLLYAIGIAAFARLRKLDIFLLGLPLIGMLSMPISWLLLERWKWVLMPQIQPLRALLFVAVAMQFLTAAAGVRAMLGRRAPEAFAWFAMAYLLPLQPVLTEGLGWRLLLVLPLAALALPAVRWPVLSMAAFFVIPVAYPALHTPELAQLSAWARASTPQDAVFVFPDAGHSLAPGIFRAEALRAVFVDWKGGGQVNYGKEFAEQWWTRWQLTMTGTVDLPRYQALGIAYVVVMKPEHRTIQPIVFQNQEYSVIPLNPDL